MTRVTITMHVLPAKRRELLQSLHELIRLMQQEPGCLKAHLVLDINDQYRLTLIGEWQNEQALECYIQSEYFSILQGAMKLLTSASEMTITPVTNGQRRSVGTKGNWNFDSPLMEELAEQWVEKRDYENSERNVEDVR